MRFQLPKESLQELLQLVGSVIDRKQALPILSHLLLTCNGTELSCTATDTEVELKAKIAFEQPIEPFSFTLPARKLLDITRVLPDQALLSFETDVNRIKISSENSRFFLPTLNPQDFPVFDLGKTLLNFSFSASKLRFLLEKTHFSMAHQDVRFFLNGLLFEVAANEMKAVTSDGHRLAIATHPVSQEIEPFSMLLPRKTVLELLRLLDATEEVLVRVGENFIYIESASFILASRLIEAQFPPYEKLIPKDEEKNLHIEKSKFRQMLQRVAVLSNERSKGIFFSLKSGILQLHAQNMENEEATEECELPYTGVDVETYFNVQYLLEALQALPDTSLDIIFSSKNSMLIKSASEISGLYIIMPQI